MKLKCRINGLDYDIVQGASFVDNFNETLDSGTICLDQVRKINDIFPYDDVYIWNSDEEFVGYPDNGGNPLPSFFKHMLIDSFSEELLTLENELYRYTINLFSETKKLEKIILPNISITQSLKQEEKRTCWFYLKKYLELYSPKYKKVLDSNEETWEYEQKYTISESGTNHNGIVENLKDLFDSTICPEMSFTNPSLKDVLTQIMLVKDIIPFVKNDVVYGLDIGNLAGTFNREEGNNRPVNFSSGSMSSSNFATDARREYGNALSQENSARCVEYIGFRNPNGVFLDLENLTVQTRYPIYKINKFYICYYKKYEIRDINDSSSILKSGVFLCKHDMTKLILQNSVRNSLTTNWQSFVSGDSEQSRTISYTQPELLDEGLDFASRFKLCTVGYDIGTNQISGWGTSYEYLNFLWFQEKKTYIENIINLLENINPGDTGAIGDDITKAELMKGFEGNLFFPQIGFDSIVALNSSGISEENISNKIKSMFFEIDYDAFYNGVVSHSKDDIEKDDITTVDNCSSALTVLEMDGLQQKEKMDRLGNKIFKFTARYDRDNGGARYSRVQNVGTYDEKTNSIVYMREYQVYDNLILANYEATHEYVLKNYFTSVWAKYRTYSLMSYGESIKRSENRRQLVLLSEDKKYYESVNESNQILTKTLLSAFSPTEIDENGGKIINSDKINAGFFRFQEGVDANSGKEYGGYFLSDINSFACGNSICFNIAMDDNVSGGNYIKNLSESLSIFDGSSSSTEQKTTQEWWQMVASSSDAFAQNIGVYVCHFDKNMYFAPSKTEESVVTSQDNIRKFFDLPKFNYNSEYVSKEIGEVYPLCKDNKEIVDFTFQFDYITNKNSNVLLSSWFGKLNDMLGIYKKFDKDKKIVSDSSTSKVFDYYIWMYDERPSADLAGFNMAIKIDKNTFNNLDIQTLQGVTPIKTFWKYNNNNYVWAWNRGSSSDLIIAKSEINSNAILLIEGIKNIVKDGNKKIELNWNINGNRKLKTYDFGIFESPDFTGEWPYFYGDSITLNFEKEENGFYWFKGRYIGEVQIQPSPPPLIPPYYDDDYNKKWYNNLFSHIGFWWENDKKGAENVDELNSNNSETGTGGFFSDRDYEEVGKNMYVITSSEKMKKDLVYSYFTLDNVPENFTVRENSVPSAFSVNDSEIPGIFKINVNADLFRKIPFGAKNVKSIQYYYKDEKDVLHFVFGINLEQDANGNSIFENIPIYLSLIDKRDMTVYNSEHMPVGKAANYVESEKVYGDKQYYDALPILPNEYQLVRYLKGDGNSRVNTPIPIYDISVLEVECVKGIPELHSVIAGAYNSVRDREYSLISDEGQYYSNHLGQIVSYDTEEEAKKIKLSCKSGLFYVNNELIGGELDDSRVPTEIGQLGLFYYGGRTTKQTNKFDGKIYSCKVGKLISYGRFNEKKKVLISNILYPCIRKSDNVPGFYDIKEDRFYPGDGQFKYEF